MKDHGMENLRRLVHMNIIELMFLFCKGEIENVRAGEPAAPGATFLPLLPFGPDGFRRVPPRRTHPDGGEDTRCGGGCQLRNGKILNKKPTHISVLERLLVISRGLLHHKTSLVI